MDFTIFYKSAYSNNFDWANLHQYDVFISTFDSSERVLSLFDRISAKEKHWFVTPHHKVGPNKPKNGKIFEFNCFNEDDFIISYFENAKITNNSSICIDITGFIRPFIIFLFRYLSSKGFKKIDVIYTEPNRYIKSEETEFSGFVDQMRPVPGCSATDLYPSSENDVLLMSVGYDDQLITSVADSKKHCGLKYKIFGFPSLQADMYQESVLRTYNARESLGNDSLSIFAPAFDPFVTAQVLKETIDAFLSKTTANIYISPLATKPQVLGFIIYYLFEGISKPVTIIFPYSRSYSINTCQGVNKTWLYTVELP